MACMCRICNSNEVDKPGDICELCAIGYDPYATGNVGVQPQQIVINSNSHSTGDGYTPRRSSNRKVLLNGGASVGNTDPYGNNIAPVNTATPVQTSASVQVYAAGQVPQQVAVQPVQQANTAQSSGPIPKTKGITKNVTVDNQKKSILEKWCRTLFRFIPYTLDDDVTMFQVFPDYTGTSLTAYGTACDQVIVYGRLNNGEVSENNEVEVYGRRDLRNNIIAKKIKNKATGAIVRPQRRIPVVIIWFITLIVAALLSLIIAVLGTEGIIWAIVFFICITNLPAVIKIIAAIIAGMFSIMKALASMFK